MKYHCPAQEIYSMFLSFRKIEKVLLGKIKDSLNKLLEDKLPKNTYIFTKDQVFKIKCISNSSFYDEFIKII